MIRSELDVLLDKVQDDALRADLKTQIDRLKERRSYGLVFERHIPERVRLPQREIRVGSRVVLRDGEDNPTWEVLAIDESVATLTTVRDAQGAYIQRGEHGTVEQAPIESIVVISEFGEPVLPGLRHLGSVERGGDKPCHVVIKGENHHALEALRFTHAGKIDCIYIDPPYNSGARDWKYNNDYVDENDAYRHSKWLAFMERRLKLAKELLNPDDSVLIVTIDEREINRLGLLLDQTFGNATRQMVTSVIAPQGQQRPGQFSRVEEYLFVLMFGFGRVIAGDDPMINTSGPGLRQPRTGPTWDSLLRRGTGPTRADRPGMFYPIFIRSGRLDSIGMPLPIGQDRSEMTAPDGAIAVWPIRTDGSEGRWQVGPDRLRELFAAGHARIGRPRQSGMPAITYLKSGEISRMESGTIPSETVSPRSVWNKPSHGAGTYGSTLLRSFLPGRKFPFPKSLYAVEDTIRFFVKDKPDAVVLDFFAGSGTTAHAVMRLNRQDGGRRQSIMVTNNEVSVEEAADLRKRGLRPGDPEWEALGIFEHITRPRIEAAVSGKTPAGDPIKGDYKFTDVFPMEEGFKENVQFMELTYPDADSVDLGFAFDDLAALLWLRAGAQGPISRATDDHGNAIPYVWTERYGVLFDTDQWRAFISNRPESARAASIVTYSPAVFASVASELPAGLDVVRLYDSYLSRFLPERVGG